MEQGKRKKADELAAIFAEFEKKRCANQMQQERAEIKQALKQMILHLCWAQQVIGKKLVEDIPYFICAYSDTYAKGDEELLGDLLAFYEDDCRQGERPIICNCFKPEIITIMGHKELAIIRQEFKLLDEAPKEGGTKNSAGE